MRYLNHGGSCCGILHIQEMYGSPYEVNTVNIEGGRTVNERGADCLTRLISMIESGQRGRVIEITTTSEEDQTENWTRELLRQGFVKVCSFQNSNSGNTVTIWHRHPALRLYGTERQPGIPIQHLEVPARVERRAVLTEYCPNFRVNGRGRMFSSLFEVRITHPLIRQIDRRTVFTDGSTEWETNVD